ncbi:hypothetical protein [Paracidobacterium acidisoli]|uniref:Uncharacterized protein n=1 Tax=Paracidobacterium acidisoli TaxID=2303751 RepID=A0A372ISJ4_9BACT|nr:hypothetical protein [Paracidobacterium acidisoli]MBT9330846.1 hypothetical protein [Paracidobacterium acidisoli]
MRDCLVVWSEVKAAFSGHLFIEADIGMTFALAARNALDTRECLHYRGLARHAYETILSKKGHASLSGTEDNRLCSKAAQLKDMLRLAGDPLFSGSVMLKEIRAQAKSVSDPPAIPQKAEMPPGQVAAADARARHSSSPASGRSYPGEEGHSLYCSS